MPPTIETRSSRSPTLQYPKRTPHTTCIAALLVKLQPEDGQHRGPKHVVLYLLYC